MAAGRKAAQLRGEDGKGNVRPADNRFLTPSEIAARDAYVREETGETAQQLVIKREHPEHVKKLNSRDRAAGSKTK
jgi:hypothetical protein